MSVSCCIMLYHIVSCHSIVFINIIVYHISISISYQYHTIVAYVMAAA